MSQMHDNESDTIILDSILNELNQDTEDHQSDSIAVKHTPFPEITLAESVSTYHIGTHIVTSDSIAVSKNFFKKTATDSNILPPVTRWVSSDMKAIAVERQPANITIKYVDICGETTEYCEECEMHGCGCDYFDNDNNEFIFNINVPWTVWFFEFSDGINKSFNSASVFARNSALTSMDDELFYLPITNLFPDGKVCWGSSHPTRSSHSTLSSYIMHSINVFWTDDFNNDLTSCMDVYGGYTCDQMFESWSHKTMEEVLDTEFQSIDNGLTFSNVCSLYNTKKEPATNYHLSQFFKDIFAE